MRVSLPHWAWDTSMEQDVSIEKGSALRQPNLHAATRDRQPSQSSKCSKASGWLWIHQMQLVSRLISSIWHMVSQSWRETTEQCWEYMSCQHRSRRERDRDEWRLLSWLSPCLRAQFLPEDRPIWARRIGHKGLGSSAKDMQ